MISEEQIRRSTGAGFGIEVECEKAHWNLDVIFRTHSQTIPDVGEVTGWHTSRGATAGQKR